MLIAHYRRSPENTSYENKLPPPPKNLNIQTDYSPTSHVKKEQNSSALSAEPVENGQSILQTTAIRVLCG